MDQGANPAVVAGYDAFYASWGASPTLAEVWREHVTGPDFPEAYRHISFLTLGTLGQLTTDLRLAPGQTLVDLACGAGGPGLWAATRTGATLVGVDVSPVAVAVARAGAGALGLDRVATFREGTFAETGLDDASVDAVMTIDALQYAPDKRRALQEVARILRPGGRCSFLTFELDEGKVAGRGLWDDPVGDFRPLLEDVGLAVVTYEQVEGWRGALRGAYTAILERQAQLTDELGEGAASSLVLEAALTLEVDPYCGHARIVAERHR